MSERVFACHRCGYSGPSSVDGCPRCSEPASGFRVPPLAAPDEAAPPAGGYVDLDLADDGAATPAGPAASAAAPRRRAGERTRPAVAPVAPVPHPTKGAAPVLAAVAAGCLALIGVGVFVAGRGEETAAPPAAAPVEPAAPAAAAAPSAPPSPAADAAARPTPPRAAPPAGPRPARAEPRRSRPASLRAEEPERSAPTPRPGATDAPEVVPAVAREEPSPATEPVVSTRTFTASPTAVPIPPPPSAIAIEEAPRHPTEGFRRPRVAEEGCVQRSIRLPRDAASRISGPVTVRFAVGTGGEVSLFQVLGDVADPRVSDALAHAVQGCRFLPGADAAGVPTRLWVTMPIRFER